MDKIKTKEIENYLKISLGLNEEEIKNLLELAKLNIKKYLKELETFLFNKDFENISKTAHTLKGVVLNLGLTEIAKSLKTFELKVKEEKNIKEINRLFESIKTTLKEIFYNGD